MKIYWALIAVFYFSLACLNIYFSWKFKNQHKKQYKKIIFNIGGEHFLKSVIDYLNVTTILNVGAFLAATIAALISE